MSNGSNGHYGSWIRSRRHDRGLTIEKASAATNIDSQYLRALEAGNIALLPEPYMRAFLKTYATYLGLDPSEALRRFEEFIHQELESLDVLRTTIREREGRKHPPDKKQRRSEPEPAKRSVAPVRERRATRPSVHPPWRFFVVPAAIIVTVVVLIMVLKPDRSAPGPAGTGQPGEVSELESGTLTDDREAQGEEIPEQEPAVVEQPARIPDEDALLEFFADALEDTWMQVIADGDTVVTRVVTEGRQVRVTFRDTLSVKVGKNQGMRMYFNQQELTDLGPDGMILSFILTTEGMQQRRLTYPPDLIPDFLNIPPGP